MNKIKAFTVIEVAIILSLFMAIALLLLPFAIRNIEENRALNTVDSIISELNLARESAYAQKHNKSYGIYFSNNYYSTYIGPSYASAESTLQSDLPGEVNITNINLAGGGSEILFNSGSFRPNTSGTVTITDGIATFQISINDEGFIEYTEI